MGSNSSDPVDIVFPGEDVSSSLFMRLDIRQWYSFDEGWEGGNGIQNRGRYKREVESTNCSKRGVRGC